MEVHTVVPQRARYYGVLARVRAGRSRVRGFIPGTAKRFFFFLPENVQTGSGNPPSLLFN
jgi:hypothetical protein